MTFGSFIKESRLQKGFTQKLPIFFRPVRGGNASAQDKKELIRKVREG